MFLSLLQNVQSKSNLKINVKKLKGILENKQKEKKKRMWDNSPSTLRERMMAQLRSSRFRFINETLYNNTSFESKKYFKDDPEAFNAYHEGYKQQVANWPLNPVDIIIESIKKMQVTLIVHAKKIYLELKYYKIFSGMSVIFSVSL